MRDDVFLVDCAESLQPILVEARGFTRDLETILIDSAHLSSAENAFWTERIDSLYSDCGCRQGSVAAAVAATACVAISVIRDTTAGVAAIGIGVAVTLLFAALGKGAGLWLSRARLREELFLLHGILKRRELANREA